MTPDLQTPFDVGIVTVTVVRETLPQALRSVFAQKFAGRIQMLVGVDRWVGDRAMVEQLRAQAPSHVAVTLLDLGYSTSQRNGGLYPSHYGGALKTILSYVANSRCVTYLDDDNWYAPDHLATMLPAMRDGAGNKLYIETQFWRNDPAYDARALKRLSDVMTGLEKLGFKQNDAAATGWDKPENVVRCRINMSSSWSRHTFISSGFGWDTAFRSPLMPRPGSPPIRCRRCFC